MVPSRVIRIDENVWSELKARAEPFEDSPNTVLRRVFGLDSSKATDNSNKDIDVDFRIVNLIDLVKRITGGNIEVRPITDRQVSIRSKNGRVFAYVAPQKKRLKIAAEKGRAERAGFTDWEHENEKGWFNSGPEVYWFVTDDDKELYMQAAKMLSGLWEERP